MDDFGFGPSTASSDLTIASAPLPPAAGGDVTAYRVDTAVESQFVANLHTQGPSGRLVLLDSEGRVLVESDGLSSTDPDDVIDEDIPAGTYVLEVQGTGGEGTYTLSAFSMPVSPPSEPIPAGDDTYPPEVADFRDDGRSDLILSNSQGLQVLLSNGDGSFRPPESIVSFSQGGAGPFVVGDFNGDGKLDLVVANELGVAVTLGNGNGTFQPPTEYALQYPEPFAFPTSMMAGDFNGDGRLDLAIIVANELVIVMNNGDGSFQLGQAYPLAPSYSQSLSQTAGRLLVGDFGGKDEPDLAVLNSPFDAPGSVSVFLGNGDGTFQPAVSYAAGNQPAAFVAGDFNGDGRLDLASPTRVTAPSGTTPSAA